MIFQDPGKLNNLFFHGKQEVLSFFFFSGGGFKYF